MLESLSNHTHIIYRFATVVYLRRIARRRFGNCAQRAASRSQEDHGQATFRFMDLPAETRNNIYRVATQRDEVLPLRRFKPPAITRVCRQLRMEGLPVFFDVNTFAAEVKATYYSTIVYNNGLQGGFLAAEDIRYDEAGTLRLRRDIISLLALLGLGPRGLETWILSY